MLKNKENKITDTIVLRDIFAKFYFSSVFAIICGCLGQIVGNIIVGNRLGEGKLSVVSLALPIYYVFATIGNLMGIGGSTVCAKLIGECRADECKKAYTATLIINYGVSVIFSVIFLVFLPQIVRLLGTPDELYKDVYGYAFVMIIGGCFTAGVYISFNMLRLDGKTFATTLTFVIMVITNIVLDFLLVPLGMVGISIANILGSFAASVFGIILIAKKSEILKIVKLNKKEFFDLFKQIIVTGSPGATENGSILVKSYIFNSLIVSLLGTTTLNYLSIVNSVNSFSLSITVGCAGALLPMISVFSASRDSISMRRIIKAALSVSFIILACFSVILYEYAPQIVNIFGIKNGTEIAVSALRIFTVSLPFALFANTVIYMYLGNSHTAGSNILTLCHSFIFPAAGAYLLIKKFGVNGLWYSFVLCEILTIITAFIIGVTVKIKNPYVTPFFLINTKYEKDGKIFHFCSDDSDEGIEASLKELEKFCDESELDTKTSMLINLSMDEMTHLAKKYSTSESKYHIISMRVLLHSDVIIIRLRYDGKMFNPVAYYESKKTDTSDIDAMIALSDMLGMKLVTDTCSVVDYRTTFDVNNLTIII